MRSFSLRSSRFATSLALLAAALLPRALGAQLVESPAFEDWRGGAEGSIGALRLSAPPDTVSPAAQYQSALRALRGEVDSLRAATSHLTSDAASSIEIANMVVQWSAVFLAGLTILTVIAGYFGVREYRNIRQAKQRAISQYRRASREIHELQGRLASHETELQSRIQSNHQEFTEGLSALQSRFAEESFVLLEATFHFNAATHAYRDSDFRLAIQHLNQIVPLQPRNARVYCRLGRAYTNLDDHTSARINLEKALEVQPDFAEALTGLAAIHRYTDHTKALDYARRAAEAPEATYKSLDYHGLLLRDTGNLDGAMVAHQRAKEMAGQPETKFFLSLLHARRGEWKRAQRLIAEASEDLDERMYANDFRKLWGELIEWARMVMLHDFAGAARRAGQVRSHAKTGRELEALGGHARFLAGAVRTEANSALVDAAVEPLLRETAAPAAA